MKRKVYICSPKHGDVKKNIQRATLYTQFALKSKVAPVTPHFFALCLDTEKKDERELIESAGINLLWFCDEMWIFGEEITDDMKEEINFCKNLNIKMRRIKAKEIRKIIGGKNYEKAK